MSLFTKIIRGDIKSDMVYEDDILIVIKDINPKAKTHLLIIPKKEILTINHLKEGDKGIIGHMFFIAKKIALKLGIQEGYTLHCNVGEKGGQEIMHVHLHLLSDL